MRQLLAPVAAVLAVVVLSGCSSESAAELPRVDLVGDAVAAASEQLGYELSFFEINADAQRVNLFVAGDGGATVTAYLYVDGELIGPAPPQPVESGFTFGADAIDFNSERVLDQVRADLPESELVRFVITADDAGRTRYEVFIRSRQGGSLIAVVSGTGEILAVIPV